jgi:signal transduction histidine kinase
VSLHLDHYSAGSRFIDRVSHELRTSLNSIVGFSEMLEHGFYGDLSAEQRSGVSAIREAGHRLLGMVDEILVLAASEMGAMRLQESDIDCRALVEQAAAAVAESAAACDIVVSAACPPDLPALCGDARLVRKMLDNLLVNALQFTLPPGTITVAAERRDDGGVTLLVRDDGIGIPAEDLAALLRPAATVATGGLGLVIVKSLLQSHGGRFRLDSVVGRGTVAALEFPPSRSRPQAD